MYECMNVWIWAELLHYEPMHTHRVAVLFELLRHRNNVSLPSLPNVVLEVVDRGTVWAYAAHKAVTAWGAHRNL
jgi:hypothetical protein